MTQKCNPRPTYSGVFLNGVPRVLRRLLLFSHSIHGIMNGVLLTPMVFFPLLSPRSCALIHKGITTISFGSMNYPCSVHSLNRDTNQKLFFFVLSQSLKCKLSPPLLLRVGSCCWLLLLPLLLLLLVVVRNASPNKKRYNYCFIMVSGLAFLFPNETHVTFSQNPSSHIRLR